MINKTKIILVFSALIVVWLLSYAIHLIELRPSLDLTKLYSEDITSIKINDRGILGNNSVLITDVERLKILSRLIVSSSEVDYDDINIKSNHGLCEVELHLKNKQNISFIITKTSFSGGILNSGDYYYRNDSLLVMIIESIRHR